MKSPTIDRLQKSRIHLGCGLEHTDEPSLFSLLGHQVPEIVFIVIHGYLWECPFITRKHVA